MNVTKDYLTNIRENFVFVQHSYFIDFCEHWKTGNGR